MFLDPRERTVAISAVGSIALAIFALKALRQVGGGGARSVGAAVPVPDGPEPERALTA